MDEQYKPHELADIDERVYVSHKGWIPAIRAIDLQPGDTLYYLQNSRSGTVTDVKPQLSREDEVYINISTRTNDTVGLYFGLNELVALHPNSYATAHQIDLITLNTDNVQKEFNSLNEFLKSSAAVDYDYAEIVGAARMKGTPPTDFLFVAGDKKLIEQLTEKYGQRVRKEGIFANLEDMYSTVANIINLNIDYIPDVANNTEFQFRTFKDGKLAMPFYPDGKVKEQKESKKENQTIRRTNFMAQNNQVTLFGNVTGEVKLSSFKTADGKERSVANYDIAVHGSNDRTDFFRIASWGKQAENDAKYLKKGNLVMVQGDLQTGSYDKDVNGTKVKIPTLTVNAESVRYLQPQTAKTTTQQNGGQSEPND